MVSYNDDLPPCIYIYIYIYTFYLLGYASYPVAALDYSVTVDFKVKDMNIIFGYQVVVTFE